jgi:hypothetical protein
MNVGGWGVPTQPAGRSLFDRTNHKLLRQSHLPHPVGRSAVNKETLYLRRHIPNQGTPPD